MDRDFLAEAKIYIDRGIALLNTHKIGHAETNLVRAADAFETAAGCITEHAKSLTHAYLTSASRGAEEAAENIEFWQATR